MRFAHIGTRPLETERLALREFRYSDNAPVLKNWAGDPLIQKMYSEPVYSTAEEVNTLLCKYISAYAAGEAYRWAITQRGDEECIGQIAYFMVNAANGWGEIEYYIGREYQNKGYVTEAVKRILQYGFEDMGLHKVQICHKSNNAPSKRVIEKCGFVYEGTLRDFFYIDGEYLDRLYYSMLENEWAQGRR